VRRAWPGAVLVLLVMAAYAPAPWGELVWDDRILIDNQLPAFTGWRDAFWPPANVDQWSDNYYRPILTLSYLADRALFGREPGGMHVVNVLFHLAATLGLYALLGLLLRQRAAGHWGALAGAALFAVHPIHTETVSWILGRSDAVAALFLFPATALALRWRDGAGVASLIAAAVGFALALLSKEVAAAGLLLIPATLWLAPRAAGAPLPDAGRWLRLAIALLAALAAVLALRQSAGDAAAGSGFGTADLDTWPALQSLAWFSIKAIWPWPQSIFVPAESLPGVAVTLTSVALLLAVAVWGLRRWRAGGDALPLLALLWFGATAAPTLAAAAFNLAATPVAERQLYLPSAAVSLLAALAVAATAGTGRWRLACSAAVIVILGYGATTVARGFAWQDNERLWSDAVAQAPAHGLPANELAVVYAQRGDIERAFALWQRARTLINEPKEAGIVEANLGNFYLRRGEERQAFGHFDRAVQLFWAQPNAHQGLGRLLMRESARIASADGARAAAAADRATLHYRAALEFRPAAATIRFELADALARLGQMEEQQGAGSTAALHYAEARAELERALASDPAAGESSGIRSLRDFLAARTRG